MAFQSDWATNVLVGLHTNTFNEYSFGGYTLDDGPCGSGDPGGYYVLNGDNIMLSPQNMLPTNLTVISPSSPLTLTEMLVNGNTNSMSASFTNPVLAQLHNDITDQSPALTSITDTCTPGCRAMFQRLHWGLHFWRQWRPAARPVPSPWHG